MTRNKLIEMLSEAGLLPIRSTKEVIVYQKTFEEDDFIELCIFEDNYTIEYFKKVGHCTYNSYTIANVEFKVENYTELEQHKRDLDVIE